MHDWAPEIEVHEALVLQLIAEQFPDLDASSARLLAEGWDNAVWVIEERWAFRFPRREIAVPGVERELALLSRLAPLVPLPIPVPELIGHPSDSYPWPFFGAPLLPGREADASLSDDARVKIGAELGRFLRALHQPEVARQVDPHGLLPIDPNRRGDMTVRIRIAGRWLAELEVLGVWRAPDGVQRLFDQARELAPPEVVTLVHSDLHFRHVLVGDAALASVIDWDDICLGDPALDVQLAWSFLPPAGREAFLLEYGSLGEAQMLRARVLAIGLCAALSAYGRHERLPKVEREALAGLERTLVDWS
jgi:aminoglycoside phosphotransferase (APT) family kinase protein